MKRTVEKDIKALQLGRITLGLSLATGLLFAAVSAEAQINRSRPPSGGSSGGSSGKSGGGSSEKSGGGSSSGSSSGGSSRSDSNRGSSGSGGSSSGGERTRTPSGSGGSYGSGSSSDRGSSGSSGSNSGGLGGIFNRSRPNTGNSGGSGVTRSGSNSRGGVTYNTYGSNTRGNWSNSREAASGRLAPFSYNRDARSRTNFPSSLERFTQSREGQNYRYNNGTFGRSELYVYNRGYWNHNLFLNNAAYYPYYRPAFVAGVTCYSPFAYYGGIFPTYINLNSVFFAPPPVVYIPYPVYNNLGVWSGYRYYDDINNSNDDYYLNQRERQLNQRERELNQRERELNQRDQSNGQDARQTERNFERILRSDRSLELALNDITEAWRFRDIQSLAKHTRKDAPIAVYLRGKYQYSLSSVDYLDMTRDAFRTSKTVRFKLDEIERKERGIYLVSGRHTYRNNDDQERTVYVNYVLEVDDDTYYITQVGSAPDRVSDDD